MFDILLYRLITNIKFNVIFFINSFLGLLLNKVDTIIIELLELTEESLIFPLVFYFDNLSTTN